MANPKKTSKKEDKESKQRAKAAKSTSPQLFRLLCALGLTWLVISAALFFAYRNDPSLNEPTKTGQTEEAVDPDDEADDSEDCNSFQHCSRRCGHMMSEDDHLRASIFCDKGLSIFAKLFDIEDWRTMSFKLTEDGHKLLQEVTSKYKTAHQMISRAAFAFNAAKSYDNAQHAFHLLSYFKPKHVFDSMHEDFLSAARSVGAVSSIVHHSVQQVAYSMQDGKDDQVDEENVNAALKWRYVMAAHAITMVLHRTSYLLSNEKSDVDSGFVEALVRNCGLDSSVIKPEILYADLVSMTHQCFAKQGLLENLSTWADTADAYSSNQFDNTPLHLVAGLGDPDMVKAWSELFEAKDENVWGQSPLHIAVATHNYRLVSSLIAAGASATAADAFGRTPISMACANGMPAENVKNLFDLKAVSRSCALNLTTAEEYKQEEDGEWYTATEETAKWLEGATHIDAHDGATYIAEEFVGDHLVAARPAIIRGAVREWKKVQKYWARERMINTYGHAKVMATEMPYMKAEKEVSLGDFIKQMRSGSLTQVFDPVTENHVMREFIALPAALNPAVTNITLQSVTFEVSPPMTGAPWHVGPQKCHTLVYGQRKWLLFPPSRAIISRVPPVQWINEEIESWRKHAADEGDYGILEVVQNAGDVLYIPDNWSASYVSVSETVALSADLVWANTPLFAPARKEVLEHMAEKEVKNRNEEA